jgi:hypothetical protein
MKWEACSTCGRQERRVRDFIGRPERKRPLGRHRLRWEDKIKMDLQEVGWGAWNELTWLKIGAGRGRLRMR